MTTIVAEPVAEPAAPKESRRIVYLKEGDEKSAEAVNCRIVCGAHCSCASKQK